MYVRKALIHRACRTCDQKTTSLPEQPVSMDVPYIERTYHQTYPQKMWKTWKWNVL